ncbi:MAG: hypothetical protein EOO75_19880, partial [Myxococcales bacterium]
MRTFFSACLLTLGGLLAVTPAAASPIYPSVIASELGLSEGPACTICHTDDDGGPGTVTRPFGVGAMKRGLDGGADSNKLREVLGIYKLEGSAVDTDKDGVGDYDELLAGTDPNVAPGGVDPGTVDPPEYGCSASSAPSGGGRGG